MISYQVALSEGLHEPLVLFVRQGISDNTDMISLRIRVTYRSVLVWAPFDQCWCSPGADRGVLRWLQVCVLVVPRTHLSGIEVLNAKVDLFAYLSICILKF